MYEIAQEKDKQAKEDEKHRSTNQILRALQQTATSSEENNKNLNELVANLARNQAILVAQAQVAGQLESWANWFLTVHRQIALWNKNT